MLNSDIESFTGKKIGMFIGTDRKGSACFLAQMQIKN